MGQATMVSIRRGGIRNDLLILTLAQCLVAVATIGVLIAPQQQIYATAVSKDIRYLNQLATKFHERFDRWPARNGGVWELAVNGYIDYRSDRSRYRELFERFRWNTKRLCFERKP